MQWMNRKAFKTQPKPMKTELHRDNRLFFCEFLRDWDDNDFMHLAPSDELFVYSVRKPNRQNDRIWAQSLDDLDEQERFVMVPQQADPSPSDERGSRLASLVKTDRANTIDPTRFFLIIRGHLRKQDDTARSDIKLSFK
jgi:hypothetical protein